MNAAPVSTTDRTRRPRNRPSEAAVTTLAWIRALASDWTERRESEELQAKPEEK